MWEVFRESIPGKCTAGLVFDDPGFKEVAFFLQVNHLAHPWERVFLVREEFFQTNLGGAAVGDIAQIAFEH